MDDPDLVWPAWKFDMTRDDLTTTLHDKYNTFSFTLQDPEAFHHDVSELSRQACTADEFHNLMADRQQQRIRELSESMESLAVEIIANPLLMGTEQWQHAVQLFRTKSYDSIVRYFASYLHEEVLDSEDHDSTSDTISIPESSETEEEEEEVINTCTTTTPTKPTVVTSSFDDYSEEDYFHDNHVIMIKSDINEAQAPLSPPHSEGSPSEVSDSASFSTGSPSRSMSFSGSESGHLAGFILEHLPVDDDTTSQSDDGEITVSSVCDSVESVSSLDSVDQMTEHSYSYSEDAYDDDLQCTQYPEDYFDIVDSVENNNDDTLDSDTPTPRQVEQTTCYLNYAEVSAKSLAASLRRSPSPKSHKRSRNTGINTATIRRGPDEACNKVHKFPSDLLKRRSKGRGRMD